MKKRNKEINDMPLASTIYRRKGRRRLQCRSSAV